MVRNNPGVESRGRVRIHWRERVKQRRHSQLTDGIIPSTRNEPQDTNQVARRRTKSCHDLNGAFIGRLDIVTGVIDVDDENDNLEKLSTAPSEEPSENEEEEQEETDYLNRDKLIEIIELAMQKHLLDGPVSDQVVSLVSEAARERLCFIFENLKGLSLARIETEQGTFEVNSKNLDFRELLEQERNAEEERLVEEAKQRLRKYRRKQEAEGKAVDNKRKLMESIREKKKEEEAKRKIVMDNLLSGILRKRKKTKFDPLVIPSYDHCKAEQKPSISKLQMTDPVPREQTISITLKDCLQFFSSEPNTRKSELVYKWYTRLNQSTSKKKKKSEIEEV